MTPLEVTIFFNRTASFQNRRTFNDLEELALAIEDATADNKTELPWLKLAHFGERKSKDGSLRFDANVEWVSGCEGDYDAGKLSVNDAYMTLEAAGITGLVYTTPSHTEANPRWRVLCPFAERLAPNLRATMVARLNGLFGGVLADESFTLSQSYYFGRVNSGAMQIRIVEGRWCIDEAVGLDAGAIGRSATKKTDGGNGQDPYQAGEFVDIDELLRRILAGESLHPSVARIAGSYAGTGVPIGACLNLIGVAFQKADQPRYAGRWPEVERTVRQIYEKERSKNPEQAPARDKTDQGVKTPAAPLPWVTAVDWDQVAVPEQKWTVRDRIPAEQACLFTGHGGVGKSIIGLHLAAAHVTGKDFLYAMPEPGPAFFIDCEDSLEVMHRRLAAITTHMGVKFSDLVRPDGLTLLPMFGRDPLLARFDLREGVLKTTPFYEQLLERAAMVKPVQIIIASLANVFAGNENDRSQVQQFAGLLSRIVRATGGSLVQIAHPSRLAVNAKNGKGDLYSGSTQWHNAFRARIELSAVDETDEGGLRRLDFAKNQYGRLAETITLTWQHGMFLPAPKETDYEREAQNKQAENLFFVLLNRFGVLGASPNKYAGNYFAKLFADTPECKEHKLDGKDMVAAMHRLIGKGTLKIITTGPPSRERQRFEVVHPN